MSDLDYILSTPWADKAKRYYLRWCELHEAAWDGIAELRVISAFENARRYFATEVSVETYEVRLPYLALRKHDLIGLKCTVNRSGDV